MALVSRVANCARVIFWSGANRVGLIPEAMPSLTAAPTSAAAQWPLRSVNFSAPVVVGSGDGGGVSVLGVSVVDDPFLDVEEVAIMAYLLKWVVVKVIVFLSLSIFPFMATQVFLFSS